MRSRSLLWLFVCQIVFSFSSGFSIFSITPSNGVNLQAEPITVVFSHAVIAFGSDISELPTGKENPVALNVYRKSSKVDEVDISQLGQWRWITTSIARFDLRKDIPSWPRWPTDLYIEVSVNTALTSATNAVISGTNSRSWTTTNMIWNVQGVTSEIMKAGTDGAWTPSLLVPNSWTKYEVPSDGKVQVRFNSVIDLDLLKTAGFFQCVLNGNDKGVTVQGLCGSTGTDPASRSSSSGGAVSVSSTSADSYCVDITLNSALGQGEECTLQVSTSEYYHPLSGPYRASSAAAQTLVGKLPFSFNFLPSSNYQMQNIGQRGLRLWIRHGLAKDTDLSGVISVSPQPASFAVTVPEKYMVLLTGEFEPSTRYSVSVSADSSIRDGLDQPLVASSGQFTMKTPEANILFYLPSSALQFHPDDALTAFPVLGIAGDLSVHVRACDVTPSNIAAVLLSVFRSSNNGWFCEDEAQQTDFIADGQVAHSLTFPASGLLFVDVQERYGSCSGCQHNYQRLLSVSDLHAVLAVSSPTPQQPVGAVDVMVTRLTGTALGAATVSIWDVGDNRNAAASSATRVAELATTDGHVRHEGECSMCVAVVSDAAGAMAVLANTFYLSERSTSSDSAELRAQVVFDRSIYAPGERATASGWFVQKYCTSALSCMPAAASLQGLALNMVFNRFNWWDSSESSVPPTELTVDASGVFTVEFDIPVDAEYGSQPTFQIINTASQKLSIQTAASKFVIADPRLPTAVLSLTVPEYADPGTANLKVSFECKVETFTAIPLSNIEVSFRAELAGTDACGNMVGVEGAQDVSATVTTDAAGSAVMELDVSQSGWTLEDGQTIKVFASAIGPTGSPLGGSGETRLFSTIVELSDLAMSVQDPLPDVTFDVTTSLNLRIAESSSPPEVAEVGWRLVDGTSCADVSIFSDVGSQPCQVAANKLDITCADVSFTSNSETIALVVVAKTSTDEMVQACTAIGMPLVRDWTRTMTVSAELTSSGVDVSFRNPFGARAAVGWIVWQGGHSGLIDLTVSGNAETHSIAIPDNMRMDYGSAVMVQVHTWLPIPDTAALDLSADLSSSTMSKLLGTWGLLSYSGSASVAMTAPIDVLKADVSLTMPELAAPEATVTLEIDAGTAAGAGQAIVYVVDQSIFELEPAELPDTAAYFGRTDSVDISIMGKTEPLSGQAVTDAAEILAGLTAQDPYVRVQWTSKWLDGDYAAIVQGSEYQAAITYGNFPWLVNYPSYFEDDYLYYWGSRTGCPYSGQGGVGGGYFDYDDMEMADGGGPVFAPSAPAAGGEADRGGAAGGQGEEGASDGSTGGANAPSGAGVTLREGVETIRTALVATVALDSDGKASLDIDMPADRKKWSVRVHVVSQNLKFGSAETFVTVRSDIYLSAFVPRALRLTDMPMLGAIVQKASTSTATEAVVTVDSYDTDVYELVGASSMTVATTTSSSPALFSFTVKGTPDTGTLSQVVLSLTVDGEVVDRMSMSLAVDLHARPLLIGTSRAVSAPETGSGTWQDVLALPSYIEAESEVTLHAAVSQYDRIKEHCYKSAVDPITHMINADPPVTPSADDLVGSAYCLSVLRSEDLPSCSGSPCSLFNKYLKSTSQVVDELRQSFTDSSGKLHWTSQQVQWSYQTWVDVRLSSVAVLMQRLTSGNRDSDMRTVQTWLSVAVQHIRSMDARWPDGDYSWDAAHLWLATSSAPSTSLASIMRDLPSKYAFASLKSRVSSDSISLQLLVNAAEESFDSNLATAVLNALRLSSDQTGYIAWPGSASAMDEPWQQFGLLTLCQDQAFARDERVWRVAGYIGQGGGAQWMPWRSRYDTLSLLATGMSLTKLDEQTDNTDPQVDVAVTLDGTSLWTVELPVSDTLRSASKEVSADVPNSSDNAVLAWDVSGTGTVFTYLSAYLIPTEPWPTPVSRGFQVQKLIQLLDTATGRCTGDMITSATRGQLVCVSLLVTSSDDVRNVRIEDWSPSGLEPMDTNVDGITEALAAMATEQTGADGLASFCPRWWGWCYSSETREVKATSVEWTVRGFFAGSREFKYIALANVPGKYVLPSSVAEDIDNPTYTGMSGSAYFWVQGDANTGGSMFAAATIETPALARRKLLIDATAPRCAAAEDSYGGWCDEASGKWMCGQAECGTSSLPAGCAVVDGEIRCDDDVTDDDEDVIVVSEIDDGSGADDESNNTAASDPAESEAGSEGKNTTSTVDSEDGDEEDDQAGGEEDGDESEPSETEATAIPELTFASCSSGTRQNVQACIEGAVSNMGEVLACGAGEGIRTAVAHCLGVYGCCDGWEVLVQGIATASGVAGSECPLGECSQLEYKVAMKVKLPYTASEFDQQKQVQFVKAVAEAAQVLVQLVRITGFSELRRRRNSPARALLAGSIQVDVEIATATKAAAEALAGSEELKAASLNAKLETQLGVRAEVLEAASISEINVDPTPEQEGSAWSRWPRAELPLSALAVLFATGTAVPWRALCE